ncbi:AraC family ligand binding domain-containing protein [Nocardia sp. NPDC051052]|uniref:AraC family ligand binding domain-containing protein n=1 Tax=Nocardia sp. NPDC051052 TaxID=3364322 RepID=UPI0037A37D5E
MVAEDAVEQIRAWQPRVPGVVEVFHARFIGHVYPMHAHDFWTLLIVDYGAVRYHLDRHEHGILGSMFRCCRRMFRTTARPRPNTGFASGCSTSTAPSCPRR